MKSWMRLPAALGAAALLAGCSDGLPVPAPGPSPVQTYTLSGTVTEAASGGPVPVGGAIVKETTTNRMARTDTFGRYRIAALTLTPSATVTVTRGGFVPASVTRPVSGDTQIDVPLERRPTYTLTGVISEMTPAGPVGIAGVEVYLLSYVGNDGCTDAEVTSDEHGRYTVTGVCGGDQGAESFLWLVKEGYAIEEDRTCDNCYRKLTINGDTVLNIQLERLPGTDTAGSFR